MRRYKLTGRGWALAVVCVAFLFLGTYALVSLASGDGLAYSESPSPSVGGPDSTPPVIPPVTDNVTGSPPPPDEPPSPTPIEKPPSPSPEPIETPPPDPSPDPTPANPSSEPSPKPVDPSPEPPPVDPTPPPEPVWVDDTVNIMFNFDSAEPSDAATAYSDLAAFLPPAGELAEAGYIIVVTAFTASDETVEDLAYLRAETASGILSEMGVPDSMIRLYADPVSVDTQRYRQRANIYFLYVGNK